MPAPMTIATRKALKSSKWRLAHHWSGANQPLQDGLSIIATLPIAPSFGEKFAKMMSVPIGGFLEFQYPNMSGNAFIRVE